MDITSSISFHQDHGRDATLTAVYPAGRFGALELSGVMVTSFKEKPQGDGGMINGGFFVLNRSVIDLIDSDDVIWEREPLSAIRRRPVNGI